MPRYYFHIADSVFVPDEEGLVLPNLEAAKLEAVKATGEMLRDYAENFWASAEWKVIVTDEDRTVLFSLCCQALAAPEPALTFIPEPRPALLHVKPD